MYRSEYTYVCVWHVLQEYWPVVTISRSEGAKGGDPQEFMSEHNTQSIAISVKQSSPVVSEALMELSI